MIYLKAPEDFSSKFEVVSCFFEYAGRFLLLKRQDHKSEGDKWGVPAGKIDAGETALKAMKRELREETGIEIDLQELTYLRKVFVKYPDYDFTYHIFITKLFAPREIVLEPREHKDKIWVSPEEALRMNLVRDLDACIKLHYFN